MQERITVEINSSELLFKIIEKWENTYGLYNQIYDKVLENKTPRFTDKKLYSYFLVNGRKQ